MAETEPSSGHDPKAEDLGAVEEANEPQPLLELVRSGGVIDAGDATVGDLPVTSEASVADGVPASVAETDESCHRPSTAGGQGVAVDTTYGMDGADDCGPSDVSRPAADPDASLDDIASAAITTPCTGVIEDGREQDAQSSDALDGSAVSAGMHSDSASPTSPPCQDVEVSHVDTGTRATGLDATLLGDAATVADSVLITRGVNDDVSTPPASDPEPVQSPSEDDAPAASHVASAPDARSAPSDITADAEVAESALSSAQETNATHAAELAEMERQVHEQRDQLAQSDRARVEIRAAVEVLKKRNAELALEVERLKTGGLEADLVARHAALRMELDSLADARILAEHDGQRLDEELTQARAAAADTAAAAEAASCDLREAKAQLLQTEQSAVDAEQAVAMARSRLQGMVAVEKLQSEENAIRVCREQFAEADREARQLRVALAEAISSGCDLPNTLKEIELLKESAAAATQRVQKLEELNAQLEGRLEQVKDDVRQLQKGTVDLQSEGELMRDVIVQQSEQLLRRVEDLTDERRTADADRKKLLAVAADLVARVDEGEARVARGPSLEADCTAIEAGKANLVAEVERLRRTNNALCQQVLGDDAEGPFAGALKRASLAIVDGDSLHEEVARLIRGQQLVNSAVQGKGHVNVQADAAGLGLRIQQALAEREESFWVERQRLSDRVIALERARGGRTGALLREYTKAAGGGPNGGAGTARGAGNRPVAAAGGAGVGAVGAYAMAGREAATAAAGAAFGGLRRLRDAIG